MEFSSASASFDLGGDNSRYRRELLSNKLNILRALISILTATVQMAGETGARSHASGVQAAMLLGGESKKVFLVHGHDHGMKASNGRNRP
jgi:hypothetical protein